MTSQQFKKVARLLKEVYKEVESEALAQSVDIMSPEYQVLIGQAREAVLAKMGFTLEEYRQAKARLDGFSQEDLLDEMDLLKQKFAEVAAKVIPTTDQIAEIATKIAETYIKPPQITNQIVKETVVKEPINTTVKETVIQREEYDATPLTTELVKTNQRIDGLNIPSKEQLTEDLKGYFSESFKKNIDMLGIPDFRKLGMGLRQDIDELLSKKLVVVTQSATPAINTDITKIAYITGLAQAVTSFTSGLTGTPRNGDTLIIDITDNGSDRALTFGAKFEASGTIALPTTTTASTRLQIGFRYNIVTSKWTLVGVS